MNIWSAFTEMPLGWWYEWSHTIGSHPSFCQVELFWYQIIRLKCIIPNILSKFELFDWKKKKRGHTFPCVSYLKTLFNLSHSLHLHLHFMTGRDLTSEINTRSKLSPEFNWPVYFKEGTPVLNLLFSECTSLLIHSPHHPVSLISHHRHPPLPSSPSVPPRGFTISNQGLMSVIGR